MSCDYWYYNDITKQLYPGVYPMTTKVDWTKPIETVYYGKPHASALVGELKLTKSHDRTHVVECVALGTYKVNADGQYNKEWFVRNVVETKEVQVKVGIFINSCGSIFPRLVCGAQKIEEAKAKPDEKLLHTYEATIKVAK